jgi:hypothetical protein
LLLSYAFPPAALPEAYLSAKRLGGLADYDVDVVAFDPGDSSNIRIDHSLDRYVSERFDQIERLRMPPLAKLVTGGRAGPLFSLPGLYTVMDRKVVRTAMQMMSRQYRAMITWSQWHSIHLAGLELKRRFPGLPWLAHFSDPWSDNPFAMGGALRRYDRYLEGKVYRAADVLSFTSPETIDLVFRDGRPFRDKAVDLPHSFEPALYPPQARPNEGPLILRSLGNFYGLRSPEPLFKGLAILRDRAPAQFASVRVELVGSTPAEFRKSMALASLPGDTVRFVTPVDYATSLALMRSADLLLNIDAPFTHSVFLPSKLVDYIGAERPIIGITPSGTASRLIGALGGWVAGPTDPEGIASVLAAALTYVEHNRGVSWGAPEIRRSYAASTVAEQFGRLVGTAMGAT